MTKTDTTASGFVTLDINDAPPMSKRDPNKARKALFDGFVQTVQDKGKGYVGKLALSEGESSRSFLLNLHHAYYRMRMQGDVWVVDNDVFFKAGEEVVPLS